MKREDVALTVAGVIATMALAYLFYRQQQKSAAAASQVQQVQDVTDPNYYTDQGLYDASTAYQYASQLPSLSVPTISSTSPTSSQASNVDTSSSTAATGNEPGTDIDSLLSQILADFHGSNTSTQGSSGADFSSLVIPAIDTQPDISTAGIAVTAGEASKQAQSMISGNQGFAAADSPSAFVPSPVPPPSTQAPAVTSPPPPAVHNNHIVATLPDVGY